MTRLGFRVEHVDRRRFLRQDEGHGWFVFSVLYTDVNTEQPVQARFRVAALSVEAAEWRIYEIEYFQQGADRPFATVRFDAALFSKD